MDDSGKHILDFSDRRQVLLGALIREQGMRTPAKVHSSIPRRSEDGPAPLSFSQERLWFLDQYQPGSAFYNVPVALSLAGPLDVPALHASLNEIVRRHEVLRTTFAVRDGQPVQVIASAQSVPLPLTDLQHLPDNDRTAAAQRHASAEAQRPFDLAQGPLFRAGLLRLAPQEHMLLFTMHHSVTDGWSLGVLVRELAALYLAFCAGRPSPLPALPLQYADYAVWQRQWLQGEVLERQLAYWEERLTGLPVFNLPTDRPRPAAQRFRGAAQTFAIAPPGRDRLQALARQEGVTPYMVLLAAFQVVLGRYSGQEDIVVGTPVANRSRAELEGLIGFFVNTLVLRTELSGNPSFRQVLRRVREAALGAYAHPDLPFEKLVAEVQPVRDPSRNPLFQVMFALQNPLKESLKLPDLQISRMPIPTTTTQFDLSLVLRETPHGLLGWLEHDTDLFDEATAQRMAAVYQRLLGSALANPERRIADLPLLGEAERRQVLVEWAGPRAELAPSGCLHQGFESQVERVPDAVALVDGTQHLTYRELNRRANQLAHRLRSMGIGPEQCVALCLERSMVQVVGVLAVLKAGGAYVPLDPAYPGERLQLLHRDSQAQVVVTQTRFADSFAGSNVHTLYLDAEAASLAAESDRNPPCTVMPENLAYIIYTSGSTGKPKGCLVTHHNVVRLLQATASSYRFDERDVWTLFHSYAFDFSVWELWGALAFGGRLVVVPYLTSRSPRAFYELLCEQRVTVLNQTPSAFYQLVQAEESPGADPRLALRLIIFGGEALDVSRLRSWFARHGEDSPRLVNMYGITETTVHVTYGPLTTADTAKSLGSPIGRPLSDLRAYVLDGRFQPVPVGVPGELFVGGGGLARGYLRAPDFTAERFLPDPFGSGQGARLYRTGDQVRWRADGSLEFLGRVDHQLKIHGYRIEPGEIEVVLRSHPAVHQAVVVAREDTPGNKRLVAYVVAGPDSAVPASDLRQLTQQKLPEYMRPAAFIFLDALPLTEHGKLNRATLPSPEPMRPVHDTPLVAPRTGLEHLLTAVWGEVLHVREIGVEDNFFDSGGNSIQAALVINQLQQRLGEPVAVSALFETPTIAGFADYVRKQFPAAVSALEDRGPDCSDPSRLSILPSAQSPEALLANLDRLSEEEVDALLQTMKSGETDV
jgi:amino acid adenylation domain-containing protein